MHVLPSSMALSQQVSGKLIFFCLQCLFNLKMRLAEKSDICLRLFFLCFPHTLSIPILMSSFQSNILLTYFPGCLAMIFLKTRCYFKKNSEIICQISVPHEYKIKYIGHHVPASQRLHDDADNPASLPVTSRLSARFTRCLCGFGSHRFFTACALWLLPCSRGPGIPNPQI